MTDGEAARGRRDAPEDDGPHRFAVIDLAIAEGLRRPVMGLPRASAMPLFAWKMATAVLEVGPWLVRLADTREIDTALAVLGAERPWGYFVDSRETIVSLRQSLRRFNMATVPGAAKPVLFRYWDPRVMETFLRVATPEQREKLFDRIDRLHGPGGRYFDETALSGSTASGA